MRIVLNVTKEGHSWRANEGGEAEHSGASCDRAKQGIELVRVGRR